MFKGIVLILENVELWVYFVQLVVQIVGENLDFIFQDMNEGWDWVILLFGVWNLFDEGVIMFEFYIDDDG